MTLSFLPGNPNNKFVPPYSINKDTNTCGYRSREFTEIDWSNSIVLFGCSYVFGTGLPAEHTISAQLENILGIPVINMGVPASSIFYSFSNQLVLHENKIKPLAVINCWSSIKRLTYFWKSSRPFHLGPWIDERRENINIRMYKKLFSIWNLYNENSSVYSSALRRSAKTMWDNSYTKHLEFSFFDETSELFKIERLPQIDFGSDNSHPGAATALQTANFFAEQLY